MVKNVRIWFRVDGVFVKEVQNAIKGEFNQMSVSDNVSELGSHFQANICLVYMYVLHPYQSEYMQISPMRDHFFCS